MRDCQIYSRSIKQYSTIEILCKYKDDQGIPLSLAGMIIKSDMYSSSGRFVDSLVVTVLDVDGGVFVMIPTIDKLPADTLSIDVLFEKDGKRVTSDTFTMHVERSITNPDIGV